MRIDKLQIMTYSKSCLSAFKSKLDLPFVSANHKNILVWDFYKEKAVSLPLKLQSFDQKT